MYPKSLFDVNAVFLFLSQQNGESPKFLLCRQILIPALLHQSS